MGGLQNIDLIDHLLRHMRDAEPDFRARSQFREQNVPQFRRELFGVVYFFQRFGQSLQNPFGRQNDSGGENRPGQRPPSGFINACDPGHALLHQRQFKTEPPGR